MHRRDLRIGPRRDDRSTCPFCRERIHPRDAVRRCAKCGTAHHEECARELERCTIMGCGAALPSTSPVALPAATTSASANFAGGCAGVLLDFAFQIVAQGALELLFALLTGF